MLYYFLSSYTIYYSPSIPTYLDHIPLFLSSFITSSPHLILLSLTLTYFLLSYPAFSQCIMLHLILYFLPSSYPASFQLSTFLLPLPLVLYYFHSFYTTSSFLILLPLILYHFFSSSSSRASCCPIGSESFYPIPLPPITSYFLS